MKAAIFVALGLSVDTGAYAQLGSGQEAIVRANFGLATRLIEASKKGDDAAVAEISIPNASYLSPSYAMGPLKAASLASWAKSCSSIVGVDPEVIGGNLAIPSNVVDVKWQCPSGSKVASGESVVEVQDGRLAFVRTIASELRSRVVVVRGTN